MMLLSMCNPASGQNLKFDNYTSKDGLVSDDVYKMFQDKKGYMWFFTKYGTMKYNGKTFEQVLKNLPFGESFVYSYYENDKGHIWIANSNAKIYEVKNDSAFIIVGTETLSRQLKREVSEILNLYVDSLSNIYINSKMGGYKFIKAKGYQFVSLFNYKDNDSISTYVLDIENNLVPAASRTYREGLGAGEVSSINIRFINPVDPSLNFKANFVGKSRTFTPTNFKKSDAYIYFIFYDKIMKIKPDHSVSSITMSSFVLHYAIGKNGHIWAGTLNNGLYEIDQHDSVIHNYFPGKTIDHVFFDSEGGLWVSTEGSGVFHCKNLNEEHFEDSDVFGNTIKYIKKIGTSLFLSDHNGNIFRIKEGKVLSVKKNNKAEKVSDIIKYGDGYIICYRFQMEFLRSDGRIEDIPPITNPNYYYSMKLLKLDSDSILCVSRNRILFLRKGLASILSHEKCNWINTDHKIFSLQLRNNSKLITTDDGVYVLSRDRLIQPKFLLPTQGCKVVNATQDEKHNFWFCTEGYGLFKLSPLNTLTHYNIENNLPSNIINDVSFDSKGGMLLSTNKGLFYSLNLFKWEKLYSEQVRTALEFNNEIFLTTENGLIVIKNHHLSTKQIAYFNLASLLLNGKATDESGIKELAYNQNNLTFSFDVISYSLTAPDIIYNLKGGKNYSNKTGDQRLIFQNLPPGEYTLTAWLASASAKPLVISFTIYKAFWQTGWFICLCICSGLIILIFIGSKLIKYSRIKESKKKLVQQQISEYKLIALKAQINPHFMSNCLTAIQHLIFNNKVDEANEYLAKFSLLVRQVLNFSSKPLVTLKEELEIVVINIELEQLRFENKFIYELVLDKDIVTQNIHVPPLIFQPIIENAIWHGLLPLKKTRSGKLKIMIYTKEDLLFIQIEDNGVGRKIRDDALGNLKNSKGIDITRQRIQNLNVYHNKMVADLIYEDLVDDMNYATGTRVTIILPVNLVL
jgi:hypothetical protein